MTDDKRDETEKLIEKFEAECEAVANKWQGQCIVNPHLDCFSDDCCRRRLPVSEKQTGHE